MKSICVYCGSSPGHDDQYKEAAVALGRTFAEENIRLVYGGAKIGIMGAVAKACLDHGGVVTGIIPGFLDKVEITNTEVTELIQTNNMHERKTAMVEKSDGFIAMPGGFGTLEELAEVMTWAQLGLVKKPIGILNVNGFYDRLLELFKHMHQEGFVKSANLELFVVDDHVEGLLTKMKRFQADDSSFEQKLGLT
ncbi:TIGR00730 family Rossman fold protein [Reichenbachiella carrageenanivorans]|uniref:Cytokinin riboside 5'-monophosphate phosphoribohydrolase n=1 Tax=Reichenbachiella carrageenanivorans TaxID=2979869 RepID=A0ABY6D3H4_9BACT|nr:TIGR00730 family Rossman fold protein [Reichenbachiella carrageenanivorans]UXX80707.1 TIGR00730 family Rossman fold protein [Reichenbachiella carrageenanivorans]